MKWAASGRTRNKCSRHCHNIQHTDLHTTEEKKQAFLKRLDTKGLDLIGNREVKSIETLDGFKFRVKDGWLMFRPSGTEPVLRIYSEAPETWSHIEGMLFALYPDAVVWMER